MDALPQKNEIISTLRTRAGRGVRALYRALIEPRAESDELRRKELIFNSIATTLTLVLVLLDLCNFYSDITNIDKVGFSFLAFSPFVLLFGSLLLLSRKGHTDLASYIFIGLYFLATTYGVYAWGTAVPISLLSYGAIIVITSLLINRRMGLGMAILIIVCLTGLEVLESKGYIASDLSWRQESLQLKDAIEDSFVYALIMIASWISNREIERSLVRARASEKALKEERDLLEVKVDERTRELKAAELEKVAQLYRFVEFGRLSSGIFHDLMNPLSVISLSIEKLGDREVVADMQSRKEAFDHIDKAIRASKRMESFMQTARKQLDSRDRRHFFSANGEISDAVNLLTHKSLRTGVEIVFAPDADVSIFGNPVKFFQIAVNLISNAIDSYADAGAGSKRVRASMTISDVDPRLALFTVEDDGCGIKDDLKKAIFEPFFTTKHQRPREESGFGLGLSTTKDIVEKDFSGTIELVSVEGKGSRFTIAIPQTHARTQNPDTDMPVDRTDDTKGPPRA